MKANAQNKASIDPMRKTALAAGLLYIATFVFSIPALGFYDDVLNNPDFVLGAGSEGSVQWGALFEIVTALAGIGTAVVLYPVVKRTSVKAAVGFAASRVLEASMIFVGVVSVLSIVTLRQNFAGGDASALVTASESLVAVKDWTFLLGPGIMAVVNALCLAPVMYRSGLVPRIIPALGLVGAPILLASSVATLFGLHDQVSTTAMIAVLPIAIWEFSLGTWMTFKGFRSPEAHEAPAVRGPAYSSAAV
jgi:hypothetical protein